MNKLYPMLAAAVFALSIVTVGCTKAPPPPQSQPAKKEMAGTQKKAAPKPRVKLFTGAIEALDVAAGTLTLKGPKGEMRFHAHEKVKDQLDDLDIGDKVIVKHVDMIALSIVKPPTSKSVLASMTSPSERSTPILVE